ncbi:bifunctional 5,10-methylenetetrahydrofolate dehydrogenase/5,10-methenyltetrahydrofolate cyclohydrolase [Petrotoga olearia]|uniref:Bifunctional protein FolD n=2 Tax=Petrotoga olearia TaxID=156203 RepID=A0A2K1NY80_9BACT|nr:bifunctional 5,10-methylenetetrahydrofolate dehydrogenase/5,10-methenyltetrahydrofolate cyclohydrolase [Petrotoga olearia]PNR95493.1 methenyltetrahydrofolate cyclohydrolase [Petrotoga olearia DSM 13574]RMA72701.1 methylenetetrahydrofolate dehydrogenase (NADP+)/methenyltetrahydrofolate cyclohydrolase [Petrotoga olearia]
MLIEVKNIIDKIKTEISSLKEKLSYEPKLVSLVVEPDESTKSYLNSQKRNAKKYGINLEIIESSDLIDDLRKYNEDDSTDAIFVARPLKKGFTELDIAQYINPEKDVEGVSLYNIGSMFYEKELFVPCTADAVVKIIEDTTDVKGKNIVILGRSTTVGKPAALMLQRHGRDATVTVTHTKTKNLKEIAKSADILVAAIGKANFVDRTFVRNGMIVIDVGINVVDGMIVGDVDKGVSEICQLTPVPGGVGSVTTAILMRNVFRAAINKKGDL